MKGFASLVLLVLLVSPSVLAATKNKVARESSFWPPPEVDPIDTTTEEPDTTDTTDSDTTDLDTTDSDTTDSPAETTTLPPPVLCEEGDDFLPADDCRRYYQCLYGEGVEKVCPENLYWDPVLNVCGWDTRYCTNGEIETTPSPGGLTCANSDLPYLPYPLDCRKYIQCANNIGFLQNCPPGLYWSQPLQACDFTCDIGDED